MVSEAACSVKIDVFVPKAFAHIVWFRPKPCLLIDGHEFMFAAERFRTEFSEGMVPLLPSFLFLSFPL